MAWDWEECYSYYLPGLLTISAIEYCTMYEKSLNEYNAIGVYTNEIFYDDKLIPEGKKSLIKNSLIIQGSLLVFVKASALMLLLGMNIVKIFLLLIILQVEQL